MASLKDLYPTLTTGDWLLLHPAWHELLTYLGSWVFNLAWVGAADSRVHAEFLTYPDAATFYRESDIYLYHLVGFWLQGIKRPYFGALLNTVQDFRLSLLDYGCGIGCDGLWLLDAGFNVSFADVPSRSLDFLRWRLARRGYHHQPVYEIPGDLEQISRHDVVWCIDVLEHLLPHEHTALLDILAEKGDNVFCTLVDDKTADGRVHHPVDIEALTTYAQAHGPTTWLDFHHKPDGGKVRLLVYGRQVVAKTEPSV